MRLDKILPLLIIAMAVLPPMSRASAVEADLACSGTFPRLKVMVSGVRAKGLLTVELYKPSEHEFLRKASRLKRIRTKAIDGVQTVCFELQNPGTYAIAAYHDINGDRALDRQWNLMPAEPFALSNNPKLKMRMPKFEDASFKAGEGTTLVKLELRK